jgi:squalene-hopene/tetraprenyl-beta-curcumene cyclase
LTPFVLEALLLAPDGIPSDIAASDITPVDISPPKDGVERAIEFIRRNTAASGAVGMSDSGLPDYPNYATALAVKALARAGRASWRQDITPMVAYLRSRQFTEDNGWQRDDASYGAWGMGGDIRRPPNPGHVDLSMTRHVIEALAAAGVAPDDAALQKARVFVERCQNYDPADTARGDGGFYFSTVVLDANKAGGDGERYRSYGTATADGLLALLALGYSSDGQRVQAAARWLVAHHQADGAPGFSGEAYRRWTAGLWFYYAASSSSALQALRIPGAAVVAGALQRAQRPDGSWRNTENLVKEDDPLIATGFALTTLARALQETQTISPRRADATLAGPLSVR